MRYSLGLYAAILTAVFFAVNMEYMAKEQTKQGARLERLEKEPAESHKYFKRTILTSIITTFVGAVIGAVLALIIH